VELRPYQQEAVAAVYEHLRTREDNPCVVLPTGTGKSLVLAQIATDAVSQWQGRVLILAHVKELLEQNADKVRRLCPGVEVGLYSAGLNRRDKDAPVLVAVIQSVYKRACELGPFDLIIVDEAHLIPPDGEGMYQSFITDAKIVCPHVRFIGLTATPYRLRGGLICQPKNILNHVCYDAKMRDMIDQGYLCTLRSKNGKAKADLASVHVRGGEFIASEIESAMDQVDLVKSACQEIVELTRDRQAVLIFTTGVAHCHHVAAEITRISGEECGIITGTTGVEERAETIARFARRSQDMLAAPFKYMANVNVLTTGFDAPNVDCVVLLRPTLSTGLYVQMVGRGTRMHPGKADCLVLDYGGNVLRHGPVDAVDINDQETAGGGMDNEAPTRECPKCQEVVAAAVAICPACEFVFPLPKKVSHDAIADDTPILSGGAEDTTYEVYGVRYAVHVKRNADADTPVTMRVDYVINLGQRVSEWVCPEHIGYARGKFVRWWIERCYLPPPTSAEESVRLAEEGNLARPTTITVRHIPGERFDRVIAYSLEPKPYPEFEAGCNIEGVLRAIAMSAMDDNLDDIPF
jgi:DNA repair protein RadD